MHKAVAALARGLLMTVAVVDNGGVVLGSTDRDPSVQSVTLPPAGARLPPGHGNVFSAVHITSAAEIRIYPAAFGKLGSESKKSKRAFALLLRHSLTHSLSSSSAIIHGRRSRSVEVATRARTRSAGSL